MERRHYLVTYDISDDKRRDAVFRLLLGHGDHAQYSVFFCELSGRELVELRARLRANPRCGGPDPGRRSGEQRAAAV